MDQEEDNGGFGFLPVHYPAELRTSCECGEVPLTLVILLIGLNGTSYTTVRFCDCIPISEHLISLGYWPSRPSKPIVAFSLDLLRFYRLLNLKAATSCRSFIKVIRGLPSLIISVYSFCQVIIPPIPRFHICIL